MSLDSEIRALFAEYADGQIPTDRLAMLETRLRVDAAVRREFIEYLNVDSALGDLAALSPAERTEAESLRAGWPAASPVTANPTAWPVGPRPWVRRPRWIGAIAFVLLVGGLWSAFRPFGQRDVPAAVRAADIDALLFRDGRQWAGAQIPAGLYRLERGFLHLQFADNVALYVEAPAQFQVLDGRGVRLQSGRLSAIVPDGSAFTVATSEATVAESGTEYSVEAAAGGSEVHVFRGSVRVRSTAETDPAVPATAVGSSQAVRVDGTRNRPTSIDLAPDRFVRTFDEPRQNYARTVKQLSPLAFYRMAIRDQGLLAIPPQYSGLVLSGAGKTPPHARGVFAGGSLRVGGSSSGRGGRVDHPPALDGGRMSLVVFAYLESPSPGGVIATNLNGTAGNFALALDESGAVHATACQRDGRLQAVAGPAPLPVGTWRHLVVTADGEQLRLYQDGRLTSATRCEGLSTTATEPLFIGTASNETDLFHGRIDELAIFGRGITAEEIDLLYRTAQQEIAQR